MAAGCVTEAFSAICALCIENREGWWLSGCHSSVVVHDSSNQEPCMGSILSNCQLFTFLMRSNLSLLPTEARY